MSQRQAAPPPVFLVLGASNIVRSVDLRLRERRSLWKLSGTFGHVSSNMSMGD